MLKQEGSAYEEPDRRPRALRYAEHGRAMEEKIMEGLPEIIDKLMSMAKEGNVAAARYLVDRIHGRPARLSTPAVADTSLPYNHEDWAADSLRWRVVRDDKAKTAMRVLGHDVTSKLGPKRQQDASAKLGQGIPGIGKPPRPGLW